MQRHAATGIGAEHPPTKGIKESVVGSRFGRLRGAIRESVVTHPSLPPEGPLTAENRVLEMRIYLGSALLDIRHYRELERVTIGEADGCDFFMSSDGLPEDEYPLVVQDGDRLFACVSGEMNGEVEIDGEILSFVELRQTPRAEPDPLLPGCHRIPLETQTRLLIHWGGLSFAMRFVPPVRGAALTLWARPDLELINSMFFSLCSHVALIAALLLYPYDVQALQNKRLAIAVVELMEPNVQWALLPKEPDEPIAPEPKRKATPGARQSPPDVRVAVTSAARGGSVAKAELRRRVMELLSGVGSSGALVGDGNGPSLSAAMAGVIGTRSSRGIEGAAMGGGIRSLGDGRLGGGTRSIGGISTGLGKGCVGLHCAGLSSARLGEPREVRIHVVEAEVKEPLAPELIHKVINQNRNQLRFCYERELQRDHDLHGKLVVSWVIGATGRVARVTITTNTMGNDRVASCVVRKVEKWRFPPPAGGGVVEVNYPVVFHAH